MGEDLIAGRYRLGHELGRGAFATTYAGERLGDGRPVAIKALDLSKVDDWKAVELFEREARVLANLDHPRIPDYIEFIPLAEDRRGYLIQERAPGHSLAALLEAGLRFDAGGLRDIAAQLLDILIYLAGLLPPVVHRDIKPANVLLDDEGRCYLVDFGSVRDAVEIHSGGSTVAGTFGYMAPEQLHGEARPSADLYGLGMTLIHLATGREPSSLPRRRLLVDFRAVVSLDEELASFLDGLIQPAPEDRYASPQAARERLRRASSAGVERRPALTDARRGSSEAAAKIHGTIDAFSEKQKQREREAHEGWLAERADDPARVKIEEDELGLLVTIAPGPARHAFAGGLIIYVIIAATLGPMLGGVLLDFCGLSLVETTWAVVGIIVLGFAGGAVRVLQQRKPVQLRLIDGRYVLWEGNPDEPLHAGPQSELEIELDNRASNLTRLIFSGPGWSHFEVLGKPVDVEAMRALAARLEAGRQRELPPA